ncbi:hypothetical protein ABPG75_009294 [Micractinium tetrahymenae]
MQARWLELQNVAGRLERALASGSFASLALGKQLSDIVQQLLDAGQRTAPPGSELPRVLACLAARLAEVTTSALKPSGASPPPADQQAAVCWALGSLLSQLLEGVMTLPERDCLLLLSAAAMPLELMPALLERCTPALQACAPNACAMLHSMLSPVLFSARQLLRAAQFEELPQSTLSTRLAEMLRATRLAPPRLPGFLSAVINATLAWEEATGEHAMPFLLDRLLWHLFVDSANTGGGELQLLVAEQPAMLRQLVRLLSRALAQPQPTSEAKQKDWCAQIDIAAHLLACTFLDTARQQQEAEAAAEVAAAAAASAGGPSLLLPSVLQLAAVLLEDVLAARRAAASLAAACRQRSCCSCCGWRLSSAAIWLCRGTLRRWLCTCRPCCACSAV